MNKLRDSGIYEKLVRDSGSRPPPPPPPPLPDPEKILDFEREAVPIVFFDPFPFEAHTFKQSFCGNNKKGRIYI